MRSLIALFVLSLGITVGVSAQAVGIAATAVDKEKNIVERAVASPNHTTLVAALKAAGLVDTLAGVGPFTVFAPVNSAFAKLPAGTVETLLKPENKSLLANILTYHVVAGNLDSKAVLSAIKKGEGKVELTTVSGGKLWAMLDGENVVLKDEKGNKSTVTAVDIKGSNGVIHVIDSVVMPK